jgi:hypothetical protein
MTLHHNDEWLHEPQAATGWQENFLFVGLDPATGTGFYLHAGRLPQFDRYDVKLAVTTAGEVVSTSLSRPLEDAAKDDLGCAGLEVTPVEPFRRWRVRYDGTGRIGLTDGVLCVDSGGDAPLQIDITFDALGPPLDMEEAMSMLADQGNDGGHYEQGLRWSGTARVGATTVEAAGLGVRDHTWGVRQLGGVAGVWWAPMVVEAGGPSTAPTQLGGIKLLAGGQTVQFAFRQDAQGSLRAFRHFDLDVADSDHGSQWQTTRLHYGDAGEPGALDVTVERALRLPISYSEGWGVPFVSDETLCTINLADGRTGFGIVEWNGPRP